MAKLVSKVYGDALFELALEKQNVMDLKEEVCVVQKIFEENGDLLKLFNHPQVMCEEKVRMIENIFHGRVSDDMTGFLTIIVKKGRYHQIPEIFSYLQDRIRKYQKIGVAHITTPIRLTNDQKKAIIEKLLETTHYESFEVEYHMDKSLIGGMVIRIDDRIIDSSIKTKLANMTKALNQIQLS